MTGGIIEKDFIKYLALSSALHLAVILIILLIPNKVKFLYDKEEKTANIEVTKFSSKELTKIRRSLSKSSGSKTIHKGYKDQIDSPSLNYKAQVEVENKIYQAENTSYAPKIAPKTITKLFDDEDLDKFLDKEIKEFDIDPINWKDGSVRSLLTGYEDELKGIDIQSNVNMKFSIDIDSSGDVIAVEILETSGDFEKDKKIIAIIKKWKFEKSQKDIQTAVINLNYLLEK
ncbi:MAG TPA: hypothetical protein PK385_10160 [Spirochaetota bacterium]|nr:hypothetical protein [Spirochaetota bacterium]HOS32767.1 hypothetical protein [Spirochaetota bacterium]HOS56409.1 hypothetical protein [Spirochaetota bacterium]HPK62220.1 hypothetical protein [Spirochaetota bacterium]HQF76639.1 hypothetical protein [Spirochaetota bacterium]